MLPHKKNKELTIMKKEPTVAVLMSTYNGEKYLKEQIESILAQNRVEVHLFVRDDVSSDNTVAILEEYSKRKALNLICGEKNLGAGSSFMHLLYETLGDFDYYAWSDQDDVWIDDKLATAIDMIEESGKQLYLSNLMCVDKDLNHIGLRNTMPADISVYSIICKNETNGCSMVFTNSFRNQLVEINRRPNDSLFESRYHDTWTGVVGAIKNEIVYDFGYHILYRQHESNEVGSVVYNSLAKKIALKIKKVRNAGKRHGRSKTAAELLRCYPEYVKDDAYICALSDPSRIINKIRLISMYSLYRQHASQGILSYTLYVLFGLI